MSSNVQRAIEQRDAHIRAMMEWHFSPETGCPFWLKRMEKLGFDPRGAIQGFNDILERFPNFNDDDLKKLPLHEWRPKGIGNQGCSMYSTGGTTGEPKQRFGVRDTASEFSDIGNDYREFATYLPAEGFTPGGIWAYLGPQGPRRLRHGVEALARVHGADFVEIDFDAPWMKSEKNTAQDPYKWELVDRAISVLKRHKPDKVFCPPILIQLIGQRFDWTRSGVKGVFAGGTEMLPETVRFIHEELLGREIAFVPTFGNALMGLARPRPFATHDHPIDGQDAYEVVYQPLQPRTLIRVTEMNDANKSVDYGKFGYLEITTVSQTWFMPRYRERDFAKRVAPTDDYPWDGVGDVQIPPELKGTINSGVY